MPPEAADRTTRTPPRRSLHEFETICPETDIRMKRLVALWLCATVWLSAGGQSRDWANTGRYAAANAGARSTTEGRLHRGFDYRRVVLGSSLLLRRERFRRTRYQRTGTAQMLARFQCDVVALRPRAVVILAGTNDIARNNGPIDEERIADNTARWPNWRGRTGCGSSSVRCFRRRVTAGAPK